MNFIKKKFQVTDLSFLLRVKAWIFYNLLIIIKLKCSKNFVKPPHISHLSLREISQHLSHA